mmetsp:Transcript_23111/g.72119  ORF Transcript_23111/g.72119 Transcript_23111/m.72119 type:complete len:333 (-) Transcript_23111:54-1052(-)|eukprot:CAMPEP_0182902040 /NCGR_PEP_ID=MMETSP0034_2-20130328/30160_1 /TAXON_ID=156128 /ORGANISM="Nephroselmis pyriformis, Strain CCMP717" /LENGTH=332 /DNA_ID=CAMNT_0025036611 /DNA_START=44 /DNA_END=1042 /DNA_ORIENTATION=-
MAATSKPVASVTSKEEFDKIVASSPEVAVHFWADWCEPCKHMDEVFAKLAADAKQATFVRVEAEEMDDVSLAYDVAAVPFFVFIKGGKKVASVEGADPAVLAATAKEHFAISEAAVEAQAEAAKGELNGRIRKLLDGSDVLLFMKGNKEAPRCGFSNKVVSALNDTGVEYSTFDILVDEDIRQGLKEYSNWPTYPQLYVKGELLGGCDVVLEMHEAGELKTTIEEEIAKAKVALNDRIKKLVEGKKVLLFMKGSPDAPRCGFSSKVSAALKETGVEFSHFDILGDNDIRQGLKEYSNWPTYPQLYVKGELLGGCDVVLEMHQGGELKDAVMA